MSINKSYVIFGLGRYGRAVAKELVKKLEISEEEFLSACETIRIYEFEM